MNLRRFSTSSPISVVKISSHCTRSSTETLSKVRVSAFIVVRPQLLRVHFAEPFIALHLHFASAFTFDVGKQVAPVVELVSMRSPSPRRTDGRLYLPIASGECAQPPVFRLRR